MPNFRLTLVKLKEFKVHLNFETLFFSNLLVMLVLVHFSALLLSLGSLSLHLHKS